MYRNACDTNDHIPLGGGGRRKVPGAGNKMGRSMCFLNTTPVQSQLTPCNKDRYNMLVVPHESRISGYFVKPKSLLLCSQQLYNYHHFQRDELSTCPPASFFEVTLIISCYLCRSLPTSLLTSLTFPHHNPVCIPVHRTRPHAPPIPFFAWPDNPSNIW
jgi:hypothetical protein